MVKFGKKFFFDAKYEKKTKRKLIIGGIILAIAIIILIILLNFFKKEDKKNNDPKVNDNISLRTELLTEVYKALPDKTSYFERLSNTNLDEITITYPDNFEMTINADNCPSDTLEEINSILDGTKEGNLDDYSCIYWVPSEVGVFDVKVNINNKDYNVKLKVADMTAPSLVLKNIEIKAGETYTVDDFVESCSDNYDEKCIIDFYYNSYENSENTLDYGAYNTEGSYEVKIAASDSSDNLSLPQTATIVVLPKTPNKYLVTFDTNGGTSINGEYIEEGKIVTKPSNPTKNGYTFKEWTLNGATYDFSTPIANDITLVAEWTKKQQQTPSAPNNSGCTYGNKNYDTNKYIISVYATDDSKCAASTSQLNTLINGPLTENVRINDAKRLAKTLDDSYEDPGYKTLGILNTSGKGLVGYQITAIIRKNINGVSTVVAMYRLDTNGKRHFTINTINLPE